MAKRDNSASAKGPSQRQLRVGELLRHALSEMFIRLEIEDPVLSGVTVTVTEVRPAPDLRSALVYVIPLGGQAKDEIAPALQRHRGFLRGELGRRIELKFVPELRFTLDHSFDESAKVDALLRSPEVARDLGD